MAENNAPDMKPTLGSAASASCRHIRWVYSLCHSIAFQSSLAARIGEEPGSHSDMNALYRGTGKVKMTGSE